MRNRIFLSALFAEVCLLCLPGWAQGRAERNGAEHWVATWATAQQLMPGSIGGRGPAPARPPAAGRGNFQLPPPGQGGRPMPPNVPPSFADQTVRMIVRSTVGGRRVRIELSNMLNAQPLEIGAAHIALYKGENSIADASDRALTFGGRSEFAIPPGALVLSDPVDLAVAPLSDLAISLYLPHDTGTPTSHNLGLHTSFISKGNEVAAPSLNDPTKMYAYVWLSSVDVLAPADAYTIVALGDSITDGQATTTDKNQAWSAILADRLVANKATRHVGVVNQGISGNQVLHDGAGLAALTRFDRDVLSRPGVKWVILLEGVNDINLQGAQDGPQALMAEDLIWGYQQIIARSHLHGIRVMGATIMPEEGVRVATDRCERIRQEVNRWIRAKGNFDAIVDFDAVVRDADHPSKLLDKFNPGDHIHPNDAGNKAMADAIDLSLFKN